MVIELLDLTRGLNSLALVRHMADRLAHRGWIPHRLKSGWGEPELINWPRVINRPVTVLWWGWECPACGDQGDEKELRVCKSCGATAMPKSAHWGGITEWKREKGRLTFRHSAHPY